MPELSAADIAEGRRLDKAATEGPWDIDTHEHLEKGCRCGSCYDSPTVIQTTNMLGCQDVSPFSCEQSGYSGSDAELIVWARNHLPALLDAAETLAEWKRLGEEASERAAYEGVYRVLLGDIEHVIDTQDWWRNMTRAELIEKLMVTHRAGLTPRISEAVVHLAATVTQYAINPEETDGE